MIFSVYVDIAEANTRAGLVTEDGVLVALERCRTPVNEASCRALAKLVRSLMRKSGETPVAVGIGCPGPPLS